MAAVRTNYFDNLGPGYRLGDQLGAPRPAAAAAQQAPQPAFVGPILIRNGLVVPAAAPQGQANQGPANAPPAQPLRARRCCRLSPANKTAIKTFSLVLIFVSIVGLFLSNSLAPQLNGQVYSHLSLSLTALGLASAVTYAALSEGKKRKAAIVTAVMMASLLILFSLSSARILSPMIPYTAVWAVNSAIAISLTVYGLYQLAKRCDA